MILSGSGRATDLTSLGTYGSWDAYTGLASDGKALCGISEWGRDGRSIHVKYFAGNDFLVLQIFKNGWSIPSGTSVPARLQFDGFEPWNVPATGYGNMVEARIPASQVRQFSVEFRAATQLRLYFLAGTEGPWVGDLSGSGAAMKVLGSCISALYGRQPPRASQPFNAGPSTQPFSLPRSTTPNPQNSVPVDRRT
jgi:hypothetical protein